MLGRAHQRATITPKIDRKLIHDFCCIIILSSCSFCRTSYTLCHFWQTSALNECHSKHFHISMEMFLFCSIFHATRSKWYFCWEKKWCDCFSKDLNQLSHENTHFYWKSSKLFQIEKKNTRCYDRNPSVYHFFYQFMRIKARVRIELFEKPTNSLTHLNALISVFNASNHLVFDALWIIFFFWNKSGVFGNNSHVHISFLRIFRKNHILIHYLIWFR